MDKMSLESTFHWLSKDIVRFKIKVRVCEIFAKMYHLFQAQIVAYSVIAARHPGCHEIVSRGELRDEISPPEVILLSYDICSGANMFVPPRNKVSIDDKTLHVQSGGNILTDSDFSEGETLFVTPAVHFYD